MPKFKSAKTLTKLCHRNIVTNMDRIWCADYRENYFEKNGPKFSFIDGPFNGLASSSVKEILRYLVKLNRMSKVYLHLLIVPSLTEIDLKGAEKYVTDDILDLICVRCSGLTEVLLTHCKRASPGTLVKLVRTFHNSLVRLCLTGTKLNNQVLEAIGECPNLVYLQIGMTKFTRQGIESMFYSGKSKNVTPLGQSLQILRMMGCEFYEAKLFIADLLKRCKMLRCVTHFALWESIVQICEEKENPPHVKLTGVRYDMAMDLWNLRDHANIIPRIPKCLPEIQHLSIYNVETMDMPLFHLLSGCGQTLRSLKLDWVFPYDFMLYVGLLCPKLDTLMLSLSETPCGRSCFCDVRKAFEDYISVNNLPLKGTKPWCNLKQFSIYWGPPDMYPVTVRATAILLDIFKASASTLSYVYLHWMPDRDINDMLSIVLREKYFENLTQLHLPGASHLTKNTVWELVYLPKLKHMDVTGCRLIHFSDYLEIGSHMQEANYSIIMELEGF
ncbi:uncharacterized protein LOC120332364 [Styela clava]